MSITPAMTVGEIVKEFPATARVFEELGIDYCCGGKSPLAQAVAPMSLAGALERLLEVAAGPGADDLERWSRVTMTELADHIEATHHDGLKRELPRIEALINKVVRSHGPRDPRLEELRGEFRRFSAELQSHMVKEERVLFPAIRAMEDGRAGPMPLSQPVAAMMHEHDDAGAALERMSALTDRFTAPMGACPTWSALAGALRDLDRDLRTHIHKENNILFPAALKASGQTGPSRKGGCGGGCACKEIKPG